jgi:O-methyltransferase
LIQQNGKRRSVLFELLRRIPFVRRPFVQREEALHLRDEALHLRDTALAERDVAVPERDAARAALRQQTEKLSYDADGMKLWEKNLAALRAPRFRDAYTRSASPDVPIDFRAYICCWAAGRAARLDGDFVECGVNRGWLSLTICNYLDFNSIGKSFYLFDTYDGIPPEQITERERERAALHQYSDCYESTKQAFAPFPGAVLVRGRIPDSLQSVTIDRVAYLSIDMNIALPERAAIEFFWPKLSPGAVVVLDDYAFGGYEAQHETMDEFASQHGVEILTLPTGQGLLIKH